MAQVFHDDSVALWNFAHDFLVRCPGCRAQAFVHGPRDGRHARFVCEQCGLARVDDPPGIAVRPSPAGRPTDHHFGLPLWLQVSCSGHTLRAFNTPHLDYLDRLVSAGLRLRCRPVAVPYVNKRLASRLPKWMLAAKHRPAVIRGLAELRMLLRG